MSISAVDTGEQVSGAFKVDATRGQRIGRVSSEWFSRPADERFLSLSELHVAVHGRAERSVTRTVESRAVRVEASRDDSERLSLVLPGRPEPVAPTHWSFGQLAGLIGAPAGYLRQLPAALAGINLQYGLTSHRAEQVKSLETDTGRIELRAMTGPEYGRIYDHELVSAVMKIAGNGTGDTRWKVPGVLDWSTGRHNPFVDVTKDTTTLYASDRDVFLFLVDDTHPIEAGLPAGRLAGLLFPGVLLLELGSRIEDSRHGVLLSPCRVPEPQSVGRRGFRGDHDPPQQVCRRAFRARGGARAGELRQFQSGTVRRWHQGGTRAYRCSHG